jgi:lysophospholipase L1-like esterase
MTANGSAYAVLGLALTPIIGLGGTTAISATALQSSSPNAAAQSSLQVLTIGDSIMNGHGLPAEDAWPYLVAATDGWSVTNDGCDGAGVLTSGDPAKCDSNYAGIIGATANLQPGIVIIEGSSNDFGQNNSDLLTATVTELKEIKSEFPSAQIVGLSTLWGSTAPPAQLVQVNSQIETAVEQVGGTYIDIGQPMEGHPELMQTDDVHPNAAGQLVLATTIQVALQKIERAALGEQRTAEARVARMNDLVTLRIVK